MNNDGEIEKQLEDIFNEEDIAISNSEIEFEWSKFRKLKQDKQEKEKKSDNFKKMLYVAIGFAIVLNFISNIDCLQKQHRTDNKLVKENIYRS
jgi:hypothetical protein